MSSRTKVSKLVRVLQGKTNIMFELTAKGLNVEHSNPDTPSGFTRFTLGESAMDALRELLGMQQPLNKRTEYKGEEPLTLPAEEFDERFKKEQPGPPREPDGTPTSEGLSRKADGVEEGMGE